ncbi:PhnA protein [Candidatus Campbellbacteria bacterium]|nr:MAG: PhnA protein [Candidatus Campbellbacteria bacterium]
MEEEKVYDAFGNVLENGDNVVLTKQLKVKGTKLNLKKGTVVKNIRLSDNDEEINCTVEGVRGIVLRTEFLKKK